MTTLNPWRQDVVDRCQGENKVCRLGKMGKHTTQHGMYIYKSASPRERDREKERKRPIPKRNATNPGARSGNDIVETNRVFLEETASSFALIPNINQKPSCFFGFFLIIGIR